ncbi:hypothetical protein P775_17445 [Puniceibacterium antarcticum]|uniref:Twin-arginine translocation signal domain-containing protein n=1 Tax=Puniceibacterium antarcticum TaxID=1206336 RepID=A0A2G8RBA5_9RHOB|nr:hypothetical protein [Puniceibacterium antarcticum]PIL18827.1 hypothetical protein P775_17445 [Puniceibacterium antarcticum]
MTEKRACATTPAMSRRNFLSALPASGVALALPAAAMSDQPDPVVPVYREWLDARRTWRELADLPGNGNWQDPRSLAAEAREEVAQEAMLALKPTSLEGVGALAALAWFYVSPASNDEADHAEAHDCRAIMAIWCACTGKDGYPET